MMKNLALAIAPTFIVWLVTLLTTGTNLPTFTLYLLYCVSYLVIKEVGYEVGK
jgi:hypothetical protein